MSKPTTSEINFERWCCEQQIEFRHIKVARTQGHKRPDYAIKVDGRWGIVEIKQIDPTSDDNVLSQQLASNKVEGRWVDPGARLRSSMRRKARHHTSISAVAVLRQPGSKLIVDLYHNRFARVPIPRDSAAPFVRRQIEAGTELPKNERPTLRDVMSSPNWNDWLADPEEMCDREIEACLREFREQRTG